MKGWKRTWGATYGSGLRIWDVSWHFFWGSRRSFYWGPFLASQLTGRYVEASAKLPLDLGEVAVQGLRIPGLKLRGLRVWGLAD